MAFYPADKVLAVGSANAAAANNQALAAGGAGVRTYIAGFAVTGAGATAASVIDVTITGLTNALTFKLNIPAGAAVAVVPLQMWFDPPLPASADNAAITLNVPSFGAGNLQAAAMAFGFQHQG